MDKFRSTQPGVRSKPASKAGYYLLSVLLFLIVWSLGVVLTGESARRFLLPSPAQVIQRWWVLLLNGTLWRHTLVTLQEIGLGFGAGALTAIILAYGVAHNRLIAYLLEPVLVASQAIPMVALAPLLTVWFGPGLPSKVVVCAIIVFFPILINVVTGLRSIDTNLRDLFVLYRASRWKTLMQLEIPAAMPASLSGLKVGGTLAGMGAVVGEFVSSTAGLGYLVKQGQNMYDIAMMFAAIFSLMGVTLTIYGALTLLEHSLLGWQSNTRETESKSL